jgi:dihydropteroate synthase
VAAAVVLGARIVRVHDVAPMIDAVRVAEAIVGWMNESQQHHQLIETFAA